MKTYSQFISEMKEECPPGYVWDKKNKMCVPKEQKDKIIDDYKKDMEPGNGPAYDTWGSSGYDGGYAVATDRM